jgi:hypothetical protein
MVNEKLKAELDLVLTKAYHHACKEALMDGEGRVDYIKLRESKNVDKFRNEFLAEWLSYEENIQKLLSNDSRVFESMTNKIKEVLSVRNLLKWSDSFTFFSTNIKGKLIDNMVALTS